MTICRGLTPTASGSGGNPIIPAYVPGGRYLGGMSISETGLSGLLRRGNQPQRAAAALQLRCCIQKPDCWM